MCDVAGRVCKLLSYKGDSIYEFINHKNILNIICYLALVQLKEGKLLIGRKLHVSLHDIFWITTYRS